MAAALGAKMAMNSDIEPPIIVVEGRDVTVYLTRKDAESHLETADVTAGIYEAFDAKGRLLQLQASDKHVLVSLAETEPTHAEVLSRILRGYLAFLKEPIDSSSELDLLVGASVKHAIKTLGLARLLRRTLGALLKS